MEFNSQEQPSHIDKFCLENRIEEIDRVLDFCARCFPKAILWNCQTAMVEAFVNAVKHAHQGKPQSTLIWLEILHCSRWVEFRVWDQGPPFDWEGRLQEKLVNPPGPNATSGRGMIWIYKLTDHVEYVRVNDKWNCLKMYKCRKDAAMGGSSEQPVSKN